MTSVIEACKPFIVRPEADVAALEVEIGRLKGRREGLLGVEKHARSEIDQRLQTLERERTIAQTSIRHDGMSRLDPQVLRWRHKKSQKIKRVEIPVPRLAFLSLNSPVMRFKGQVNRNIEIEPNLLPEWAVHYRDVTDALNVAARKVRGEAILQYAFSGVIPDDAKALIAENTGNFQSIMLLADAQEWQTTARRTEPVYADPIIVGVSDGEMWVITMFDPTPIEQYISEEFTVSSPPQLSA